MPHEIKKKRRQRQSDHHFDYSSEGHWDKKHFTDIFSTNWSHFSLCPSYYKHFSAPCCCILAVSKMHDPSQHIKRTLGVCLCMHNYGLCVRKQCGRLYTNKWLYYYAKLNFKKLHITEEYTFSNLPTLSALGIFKALERIEN